MLWQHSRRLRGAIVEAEREHLAARLLFAASPIPTWLVDRGSGAILDVNEAAVSRYGHPRDAFLAMRFADLRDSPGESVVFVAHRNEKHRAQDGSALDVQVDAHELTLDRRAVLLVSATDLTAERRTQQRITGRGAAFLAKPVSGNDLINAIHAGMKRGRTAA